MDVFSEQQDPPAQLQIRARALRGIKEEITVKDDKSKSWEMTDLFSPYLATNNVEDSTRIVYKEIKILLK